MLEETKREIIDLAIKLIEFESTYSKPGELQKCAEFIYEYLNKNIENKDVAIELHQNEDVPSVTVLPKAGNAEIILNGHFDVVAGKPEQFEPKIEENKLIGRGANDMKTQVALMMSFVTKIINEGNTHVGLMFVGDEERGGFKGTKHLVEDRKIRADFMIALEPTELRIGNEAKGVRWLYVTAKGKNSHASRPWLGENALQKIAEFAHDVNKLYPTPTSDEFVTTFSLGKVMGGDALNVVPDEARAEYGIRFTPSEDLEEMDQKIQTLCTKHDVTCEFPLDEAAAYCDPSNRYIKALKVSAGGVLGKEPELLKKHAASDVRHACAAGIPGVVFGPIAENTAHQDNERVDLESIFSLYEILENFIVGLENTS